MQGAQYQPGHGLGQHTKCKRKRDFLDLRAVRLANPKSITIADGKNDLDGTRDLMLHPACVVGLADSGAHVGVQTE